MPLDQVRSINHATWYVNKVLRIAATYRAPGGAGALPPTLSAALAVRYAQAQLGKPYHWGGDGPDTGETGFDCSGLTKAAYAAAGIRLPRTAQAQYDAGARIPHGATILPGDLVFYGTPTRVHHVGIATDPTHVINAPHPGADVREELIRYAGDDFLGATQLAAHAGAGRR